VKFTWDPTKAESNLEKHGISFKEATTVFDDPLAVSGDDLLYPERSFTIGISKNSRTLYCVYTEPNDDETRIISCRRATSHERRRYEEGT
jgi:hypothetical protein